MVCALNATRNLAVFGVAMATTKLAPKSHSGVGVGRARRGYTVRG